MSAELRLRAQHSPTTAAVFRARLKQVEAALCRPGAEDQSRVMMYTLVGAVVLARNVKNAALATRITDVVRGSLKSQIACTKRPVNDRPPGLLT